MGNPLPKPELHITDNLVARALEHQQALMKIYAEMRKRELERARRELIIVRLPSSAHGGARKSRSNWRDLLSR
jgi:hypothetical protein